MLFRKVRFWLFFAEWTSVCRKFSNECKTWL